MLNSKSCAVLHNNVNIQYIGLGVYNMGDKTIPSINTALKNGYRHIDTATRYKNEKEVGIAIAESGIKREDIFITTKIWNDAQREHRQREAFENSLKMLNMEYVDLYLIHWAIEGCYCETWKVLEKLYEEKLVRAIGVCNFEIHHLKELEKFQSIAPMVNQIEIHPKNTRKELISYCKKEGIVCEAWSPLGSGTLIDNPVLSEIGKKYNKTSAQVMLRWDLQQNIVTVPRSTNPQRIAQNIDIFDFELSDEDMKTIDDMNENQYNSITGADPNNVTF